MTINVGDWIRYRCGWRHQVVIDVVLYVRKQANYPWRMEAVTIANVVAFDDVLEARREILSGEKET